MQNYWEKFEAMGTEIILNARLKENEGSLLSEVKNAIGDFSDRFSRFLPNNELAELNNAHGQKIQASSMLIEMLVAMKKFYRETDGVFDPTIIGVLEETGYDRDFAKIGEDEKFPKERVREKILQHYFQRVPLDSLKIIGDTLQAPLGFRVDTGGSGKGYIVDYVAKKFFSSVENYWISAGGDLLARGHRENGIGWEVGVQNPLMPEQDIFILKTKGEQVAIATSGIIKRKWKKNGLAWHHIIDPRTGLPVENDILSVTVIASDTLRADIFAKTVLILGAEKGLEFMDKQEQAECIIFSRNAPPKLSRYAYKYIK